MDVDSQFRKLRRPLLRQKRVTRQDLLRADHKRIATVNVDGVSQMGTKQASKDANVKSRFLPHSIPA